MKIDQENFAQLVNKAMQVENVSHMRSVIEKELLHYDILFALEKGGLLDKLTFQGGTSLGAFPFMCWRILSFRQITTILHHCAVALLLGTTLNNFSDTQFQRHEIEPSNPASG